MLKIHAKGHERKKCMPKSMIKKYKSHAKKHEEKSPYFQRQPSKRERVMFKRVQKYLELERFQNSTHLHFLIKVYDLHLLEVWFLT